MITNKKGGQPSRSPHELLSDQAAGGVDDRFLPGRHSTRHKVIDHPAVGRITLDCDTLLIAGDDLRLMTYTAAPGTPDAERLALALGTQTLVE